MGEITVAITGPTGTLGQALVPLLQKDARIRRIIGIARRPFHPPAPGGTALEYRRGDVRDPAVLAEAFAGADVVIHLAFAVAGTAGPGTIEDINVRGTLNAFHAAAAAGARRFVHASSVAAYGFHADNPVGMAEDWPVRGTRKFFYSKQKAEVEHLLADAAADHPEIGLYLLRPSIVLGQHTLGAKLTLPRPVAALGRRLADLAAWLPVPVPVPDLPLQLVHSDDVAQAFALAAQGAGAPGAYNLAGDGIVSTVDIARELGLLPIRVPGGGARAASRLTAALPWLPPFAQWVAAVGHPAIMNTDKAKRELGWTPRRTALETLRDTIDITRVE